jgi:hypothetical protein
MDFREPGRRALSSERPLFFLREETAPSHGFRLFRTECVKGIEWEELRHAFLLETILKPLQLGALVAEVPTVGRSRVAEPC